MNIFNHKGWEAGHALLDNWIHSVSHLSLTGLSKEHAEQ